MADDAAGIHAVVRPRRRQIRTDHRVNQEPYTNRWHDPARGAARRLEHQQDQRDAEYLVPRAGIDRALEERVAAEQHVANDHQRHQRREPVPPADAMAEALRDRKQQETQEQNERDVDAAQYVRRHDAVRGIQVEQRHDHRQRGGEHPERARQLVDRAFFGFDVLLGLFQRFFSDDRLSSWRCGRLLSLMMALRSSRRFDGPKS